MNGNGSGNGHANANANIKGDWTVNKRYLILDKIITAGIATFDYNEMAAEVG
jgi:hypothetical protein